MTKGSRKKKGEDDSSASSELSQPAADPSEQKVMLLRWDDSFHAGQSILFMRAGVISRDYYQSFLKWSR
jgi:hypothetical protein